MVRDYQGSSNQIISTLVVIVTDVVQLAAGAGVAIRRALVLVARIRRCHVLGTFGRVHPEAFLTSAKGAGV